MEAVLFNHLPILAGVCAEFYVVLPMTKFTLNQHILDYHNFTANNMPISMHLLCYSEFVYEIVTCSGSD